MAETKDTINEWMTFVDDHLDSMKNSKESIAEAMQNLDENELNKVVDGLNNSKTKMEEAQNILDDVWTTIQK